MIKENMKGVKNLKKKDNARIISLVERARQRDPRLLRAAIAEKEAKAAKKAAKYNEKYAAENKAKADKEAAEKAAQEAEEAEKEAKKVNLIGNKVFHLAQRSQRAQGYSTSCHISLVNWFRLMCIG